MKRTSIIVLLTFALALLMSMPISAEPTEQKTEPIITKEEAQMNIPPNHPIKYDKEKIEELLSLPATSLDDLGLTARDFVKIGLPKNMAESLIKSGFKSSIANSCLSSIGSSKKAKSFAANRATGTCCGFSVTTGVTVDGVADQVFSTAVSASASSISGYVTKARAIGRYVFGYDNSSTSNQYVKTSYNLYGEHNCPKIHEGIDVRYTDNDHESFRTICDGEVKGINMGETGFGTLAISHPNGSKNILFLHANAYTCRVGTTISGSSFVGQQGGTKGLDPDYYIHHVHIEVRDSTKTGPADDENETLASYMPYSYLYSYIPSNYK